MSPDPAHTEADARHAARSGAVQTLTIVLQAVTSATQVIFARLFGPVVYGAYQAGLAVLELASRAAPAGADKAMLRYVAAARASVDPEGVRRALGTGLRLGLTVSVAIGVGLLVAADPIARALGVPALGPALRVFAAVPPLVGLLTILIQASLAARVTRVNFWVRGLVEPVLLLAAGVTVWALGGRLRGLALAHLVGALVTVLIAGAAVRGVFGPPELRQVLAAPRVPGFTRFSLTMSVAELMNVAFQRADFLILTAYLGAKGAAVYAAAEFVTRVIANIRYAFDAIVAGVMAEALQLHDRGRLRYNLQLATRWVVTVASMLGGTVVVLRRELLGGLYGPAYVQGAGALVVLAATHFVSASCGLVGWVLVAGGRSRLILLNNLMGATFNIAASLWLVPRYGFLGGALASLGTMIIVLGSALLEVLALERVSPFSAALWKPVAAALAAVAVEALVQRTLASPAVRVPAVILAGLGVAAAVLFAAGLPPEERRWADQLGRRVGRSLKR